MTTPFLAEDIGRDEGCRLRAYPDPDSPLGQALETPLPARPAAWESLSGAPWTIGYGCTGPAICEGVVWTRAQADRELAKRLQQVQRQLDFALPWWRSKLNDPRQDVFVGLAYNLGLNGFLRFTGFIEACREGRWAAAQSALIGSAGHPTRWARQVKTRGVRLGRQILTGVREAL